MRLNALFADTPHWRLGENVEIASMEYDSRKVKHGALFVCVVGTAMDGHDFAQDAVKNGAAALLVERELPFDLPQILVKNTRQAMAAAACVFYGHPSKKMRMVGITGTNGKTTTTYMIKSIAQQSGLKVGLIGTITNLIGDEVVPTERTTPESVDLQELLARMADEGVQLCCMEVSSHSLDQCRVYGIDFDVAIFTNLTQDHLDYHQTFAHYRAAKKKLFDQCGFAVVNLDDREGMHMIEGRDLPFLSIGIRENAQIVAKEIDITPKGVIFDLLFPDGQPMHIRLNIPGLFSVYNALCAAAAALALGIKNEHIKKGLEKLDRVAGRLEKLPVGQRDFSVLLDYAHTPDALENILKTIRGFADGRVVSVFGCGGDRDRAKRPIMGEVAGRFSDFCVLTSDNPRSENPASIIAMIEEGIKKSGCDYIIIENRRSAIQYALENARSGDVILLAGKGHETYQEIKGVKIHFDEKKIVAEIFAQFDAAQ